jgi:hypothetical protein
VIASRGHNKVRYAEFYRVQSFVEYRYGMEDRDGTITANSI